MSTQAELALLARQQLQDKTQADAETMKAQVDAAQNVESLRDSVDEKMQAEEDEDATLILNYQQEIMAMDDMEEEDKKRRAEEQAK